jgi:eukaryotic-like serine/threonine-protein kinase
MDFLKKLFQLKPRVPKIDVTKRFELIGRVGQGSMSKVWRARDYASGRIVALKLLDIEKTKRLEARFGKLVKPSEGEIAMGLRHPNIVKTLEHGLTTNNEQFLVMEFVEGSSLSFFIEMQHEVLVKNRLRLAIELGEAIEYFHRKNWIHRDICPRNVLIDTEGHIKLIDFGLVVPNTPPFQAPGNRTGTANYMAPELIKRQKTDQRIDVFSYAVTLYEMYSGRLPWDAAATLEAILQHINAPPNDIRTLCKGIDETVAETIMKGLSLYPDNRWQRVTDMLVPLREVLEKQSLQ